MLFVPKRVVELIACMIILYNCHLSSKSYMQSLVETAAINFYEAPASNGLQIQKTLDGEDLGVVKKDAIKRVSVKEVEESASDVPIQLGSKISKSDLERMTLDLILQTLDPSYSLTPTRVAQQPQKADPIFRSGRTYMPSSGSVGANSNSFITNGVESKAVESRQLSPPNNFKLFNRPQQQLSVESELGPEMENLAPLGAGGPRKPGRYLGLKWSSDKSAPPVLVTATAPPGINLYSSPTPNYYSSNSSNQAVIRRRQMLQRNQQQRQPLKQLHPPQQRQQQVYRHRYGTEEVALHTPMHARSLSDYEFKRVENARSWNNLRGMWGKRAISQPNYNYNGNPIASAVSIPVDPIADDASRE